MFKEEIQKDLDSFVEKIQKEVEDMDKKKKEVEEEVQKFETIKKKLETTAKNAKEKIKLNIGGKIFTTSLTTLTQELFFLQCSVKNLIQNLMKMVNILLTEIQFIFQLF